MAFTSLGQLVAVEGIDWRLYVRDTVADETHLVSKRPGGRTLAFPVYGYTMSDSGHVFAFYSFDDQLVPDDEEMCGGTPHAYNCEDLFILDEQQGTIERIALGRPQGLGADHTVALSADGGLVAYGSTVFDRASGLSMSIPTIDGQSPDGFTFSPQFAGDDLLLFVSFASNFVPNDLNDSADVFVWDMTLDEVTRVSVSSSGVEGNGESGARIFHEGRSANVAISENGRYVAFSSGATNLVADPIAECADDRGDIRPCDNLYLHERETGQTRLLTLGIDRLPANGDAYGPSFSDDGEWLLFGATADNLTVDTPTCEGMPLISTCGHLFLYNVTSGEMTLVTRLPTGEAANGATYSGRISGNGRYIVFSSDATNLISHDTNDWTDIFRYDRETGLFELVSLKN